MLFWVIAGIVLCFVLAEVGGDKWGESFKILGYGAIASGCVFFLHPIAGIVTAVVFFIMFLVCLLD